MHERVMNLRNHLKMSQEEFGKKIGLTRFTISNLESGKRNITERVIADICREYRVNESWLRTGEGEMFREDDASILSELIRKYDLDDLDRRIVESYLKLPPAHRAVIKRFIAGLAVEADPIQMELDAYRIELEAENEEATSSASEKSAEKTKMA